MDKKPLILIVDDLENNRLMIKLALKDEEYDFIEAKNGKEAIDKTLKYKPDVILMDAVMPVMDGFEATKSIREIEEINRIPILMVTGLSEKEDKLKAIEAGVNDFISKPFDKLELNARCKSYIKWSILNKKYILITKNRDTNLPNEIALLSDLEKYKNPLLIMFRIKDYELIENFYSIEIVKYAKNIFIKDINKLIPSLLQQAKLYNTSDRDFAFLVENSFSIEEIFSACNTFKENIKNYIIDIEGVKFNLDIIISFSTNKYNIFKNTKMCLSQATEAIIYADELISQKNIEIKKNIETINLIKYALKHNKVVSYYQPLFNNKTQKIEKYESLVRIIDKKNKVISPFFFLEISKKSSYYVEISEVVIKNSFKIAKEKEIPISINISPLDVESKKINNIIFDFLDKNPAIAKNIVFEILEDENIKNFDLYRSFIEEIKNYGAKIAIDDFGSGYSNFHRILELSPDFLKIDGSLIKNIDKDNAKRIVVETIYKFASAMNIKTVAEFVSSKEIFDIVNEIGIDYSQGYFIDEPKPTIKDD